MSLTGDREKLNFNCLREFHKKDELLAAALVPSGTRFANAIHCGMGIWFPPCIIGGLFGLHHKKFWDIFLIGSL
ncbi:hypothetical protein MEO93_00900 [Dolichospermum sp. ST_sed3]|nr:hypothetical protein [Dolichospermum sp. ST_sed3]